MGADLSFVVLRDSVLHLQACTTLDDDAAEARANIVHPTGISSEWHITRDEGQAPIACADAPDTHRHLLFVC